MRTARYFKDAEFNRCIPSCSMQDMQQTTLDKLDRAREYAGIPFMLNCAYRSIEWDKARGRSGNSAHTEGRAVDVRCNNSTTRFKIIEAALRAGFKRIGIAKTFIHLDDSEKLSQPVIFHYY